jgi:hypothetical protein
MAKRIYRDADGNVIEVKMDETVNADHELAVQGADDPRVNGRSEGGALAPLLQPSPNDLAEQEATASKRK